MCELLGPDIWPKAYLAGINYSIVPSHVIRDLIEIRVLTEVCILDEIVIESSEFTDYEADDLFPKIKPGKVPKKNNGKKRYYYKKKKSAKNIE